MVALADLTTLRVGGPARRLVEVRTEAEAIAAVREADAAGEPLLILGGGSNVVVADDGIGATVVRIASRGVERRDDGRRVLLTVAAGEPWDPFVDTCVRDGLAGVECLSGIPGATGATPIQNVGAYGQDVAETIERVRAYDRWNDEVEELHPADCAFTYRSSSFKRVPGRWLVLAVMFALECSPRSGAITYPELARELGVGLADSAPLAAVRAAVLRVRARKGMVVDPDDLDTVSAGSFFTNPILDPRAFSRLEERAREIAGPEARVPRFAEPDGRIKTSAAWLVERAGFAPGHGLPGPAAISTKHTLALTNRGGATAADLLRLAHEVASGVQREFGVELVPEPVLVGLEWAPS